MPRSTAPPALRLRPAGLADLDALAALEASAFTMDRTSRRQIRHLLTKAHAAILVAEDEAAPDGLLGAATLLFRRGTAVARLYSIAVAGAARGRGVGARLLEAAEEAAWQREASWMRAEIRVDNTASLRMFESAGYRRFDEVPDYYEDGAAAARYEKTLDPKLRPNLVRVPYYAQTLDFTCGPSALMMALGALDPALTLDRTLELRLWREATTIFMTSGHGGCGPFGLALAAHRRGHVPQVVVSDPGVHMVDTVRSKDKQEVMALVQADMQAEIDEEGIVVELRAATLEEIEARFESGEIPLILISSWQIYETHTPHWVVVTGFDAHFVYVHDPWVDTDEGETPADAMNMPIGRAQFRKMAQYGRRGLRAAVFVSRPEDPRS